MSSKFQKDLKAAICGWASAAINVETTCSKSNMSIENEAWQKLDSLIARCVDGDTAGVYIKVSETQSEGENDK